MATRADSPVHPGEILIAEFLEPAGISPDRLAAHIKVPASHMAEITAGTAGINADTALRLSRAFDNNAMFWMVLQGQYELDVASDDLGDALDDNDRMLAT